MGLKNKPLSGYMKRLMQFNKYGSVLLEPVQQQYKQYNGEETIIYTPAVQSHWRARVALSSLLSLTG